MDVFNLYADAGTEVTRIQAFYKEEAINPNYDEDLKDYNAYVSFIHNIGFEITCLCNKLWCEIRSIKVDYLSSFGIFSIDEVSDPQGRVARFIYRKDELMSNNISYLLGKLKTAREGEALTGLLPCYCGM